MSLIETPEGLIETREDWAAVRERIGGFFDARVRRFGHDLQAIDYGRRESQLARFAVLAEALPLAGRSVLDVGCGLADFADYLAARVPDAEYAGVDISAAMIAEARRLRPHLDLRRLDILGEDAGGPYDLVVANGIFYLLGDDAETIMQRLVGQLFALCREAVVFTSLSAWAPAQEPGEFYADPLRVLDFCRKLTPHVVLRHDYLAHDFAVYLYRTAPPSPSAR
jgi:SAM-dependent methyltransferase